MKIRLRAFLLCALLVGAGVMLALAGRTARNPAAEFEPPAAASLAAAAQESWYCLKAENGRLAVYKDGSEIKPLVETGIDIGLLRAVDRQKLEEGICVKTYEDVLRLLEDFNS